MDLLPVTQQGKLWCCAQSFLSCLFVLVLSTDLASGLIPWAFLFTSFVYFPFCFLVCSLTIIESERLYMKWLQQSSSCIVHHFSIFAPLCIMQYAFSMPLPLPQRHCHCPCPCIALSLASAAQYLSLPPSAHCCCFILLRAQQMACEVINQFALNTWALLPLVFKRLSVNSKIWHSEQLSWKQWLTVTVRSFPQFILLTVEITFWLVLSLHHSTVLSQRLLEAVAAFSFASVPLIWLNINR